MDRQTARIADIGNVVEQFKRVDEFFACRKPALQLEAEQAAE